MNSKQEKAVYVVAIIMFLLFTTFGYYLSFTMTKPGEPFWVIYLIPLVIGIVAGGPFFLLPTFIKGLFSKMDEQEIYMQSNKIIPKPAVYFNKSFLIFIFSCLFVGLMKSLPFLTIILYTLPFLVLYTILFFTLNKQKKS